MAFVIYIEGFLVEPGEAGLHGQSQSQSERAVAARMRENLELSFADLEVIQCKKFE